MDKPHFGLTGLAVMGQNLARNVARNGFPIVVHNRTEEKTSAFVTEFGHEGPLFGSTTTEDFVSKSSRLHGSGRASRSDRAISLHSRVGRNCRGREFHDTGFNLDRRFGEVREIRLQIVKPEAEPT